MIKCAPEKHSMDQIVFILAWGYSTWGRLVAGQPLQALASLFTKLGDKGIEAEVARMGAAR